MQALISDLLTYSRAGRQDGNHELVDVQDVVAGALQNLNSRIEDAGSVVTFEDLPTLVADRKQLVSVFQNLISNSIKYRSATRESRITVTAEQQSNSWKFAVNDNGIGLDTAFTDRIFTIFQRLHGREEYQGTGIGLDTAFTDRIFTIFQRLHGREEYQGTGIGLAVVKKLIERAGGNIWVESELDEGSTFTVNDRVADVDSNEDEERNTYRAVS